MSKIDFEIFPFSTNDASTSSMKIILGHIPNSPLSSASIVVPTVPEDNSGLPHTLEHLVFCGTDATPKGYLDLLATRCLSPGTNAYTDNDHTAYTVTTASSQGLLTVLPSFLSHILSPTLSPQTFAAEVYSFDAEREKGVVFCEMAGREWAEADVCEREQRKAVYKGSFAAFEHGGLTPDISQLTIEKIRDYHQKYYKLNQMALILSGKDLSKEAIINILEPFKSFLCINSEPPRLSSPFTIEPNIPLIKTQTLPFPSEDTDYGTISFLWPAYDITDRLATAQVYILLRYLTATPASPLNQIFVECEDAWANSVEYTLLNGKTIGLLLKFCGVPYSKNYKIEDDIIEDTETEIETDADAENNIADINMSENEDINTSTAEDLFVEGIYIEKLKSIFKELSSSQLAFGGISGPSHIAETLKRVKLKTIESFEESIHERFHTSMTDDFIINYYYSSDYVIGSGFDLVSRIEELEKLPFESWINAFDKYFNIEIYSELKLIPDSELQKQIDEEKKMRHMEKINEVNGLLPEIQEQKPLTDDLIKSMPTFFNVEQLIPFPADIHLDLPTIGPFHVHVVKVDSAFVNISLAFDLYSLPSHLVQYLVLFQECLFSLPLADMTYQQVVEHLNSLTVSYEAGIGLGNEVFSYTYLGNYFIATFMALPEKAGEALSFFLKTLKDCQFVVDRVLTIAKNLVSNISELKRDGDGLLVNVVNYYTCQRPDTVAASLCISDPSLNGKKHKACPMIDYNINMFVQENFLQCVHEVLSSGNEIKREQILNDLTELKDWMFGRRFSSDLLFMSMEDMSLLGNSIIPIISQSYLNSKTEIDLLDWRSIYRTSTVPCKTAFVVESGSITASYVSITLFYDLWSLHHTCRRLYHAVGLVCSALSLTEGPLYNAIRGAGLAYNVSLNSSLWSGSLYLDMSECVSVTQSFPVLEHIFADIEAEMSGLTDRKIFSDASLIAAKSAYIYDLQSMHSTPSQSAAGAFRATLKGISIEDYAACIHEIIDLSWNDIQKAWDLIFRKIIKYREECMIVAIVPPNEAKQVADYLNCNVINTSAFK